MAKVVFLQPLAYEYPGTEILSACLIARGHETGLLIDADPHPGDPELWGADLLCFSVMTGYEGWALAVAKKLRAALGAVVVFGGPHPTHCPEIVREEGVDAVCRGEGEVALPELADRLSRGESFHDIPNLWVKDGGEVRHNPVGKPVRDLDALPPPDRALYYDRYPFLAENSHRPFLAGRGCPFDCIFCSNEALRALYDGGVNPVRLKSPEALIREIEEVRDRYGLTRVFFHDDTFVLNRAWLEEFLTLYEERVGLPFYCQTRADTLTGDLARRLAHAGCRTAFFAIESGVERIRRDVLQKAITDEQIARAARWLKWVGIRIGTYNLIGIPGETLADALETARMNVAVGADYPRCSFPTPYPGTRLLTLAQDQGLLPASGAGVTPLSQQSELLFVTKDARAFRNLHALFQTAVLFPRLLPWLPTLARLPLGPLYRAWWALPYAWIFLRAEGRSLRGTLPLMRFMLGQKLRQFAQRRALSTEGDSVE